MEWWNYGCWKTISNFLYTNDTTLTAGNKEELVSLIRQDKLESLKFVLKINKQKIKLTAVDRTKITSALSDLELSTSLYI